MTRLLRHNCDEWTGNTREDDHWKAFNDTKYQRHHGKADIRDKGHAIVKQGLLKPQSFTNRAGPQKDAFDLVYINNNKIGGGGDPDELPETFCQKLNDVAESCASLSLASKSHTYCKLAMRQWDRCKWHDKINSVGRLILERMCGGLNDPSKSIT